MRIRKGRRRKKEKKKKCEERKTTVVGKQGSRSDLADVLGVRRTRALTLVLNVLRIVGDAPHRSGFDVHGRWDRRTMRMLLHHSRQIVQA